MSLKTIDSNENVCRICSGCGSYPISNPIPKFLHEPNDDYLYWKQNIKDLISEITGITIEENDDGFPQKICALCISYLKHAVNFRQQAIKNILSLKTAKEFNLEKTKEPEAKEHIEKIILKENLRNLNLNSSQKKNDELMIIENQQQIIKEKTYFDYSQKSFIEDDITLLDIFQNNEITFNIPENFKERKCIYCRRLFMFEESYEEHIKDCIQATLQLFTKQITNLTELKENKEISPHEFIRRMIYCLKKNAQTLNEYSEDIFKFSVQENEIFEEKTNRVTTSTPKKFDESSNLNNLLLNKLCRNMNSKKFSLPLENTVQNIFPSAQFLQKTKCRHCLKLFENISDLEQHNQIHHPNPITKIDGNISELIDLLESETDGFIDLLDIPQKQNFVNPIAFQKSNQGFTTNQNQLNYRSEFQEKNVKDENKFVKCTRCNAKFLTITHLDEHVFKNHTTSKKITNF